MPLGVSGVDLLSAVAGRGRCSSPDQWFITLGS